MRDPKQSTEVSMLFLELICSLEVLDVTQTSMMFEIRDLSWPWSVYSLKRNVDGWRMEEGGGKAQYL